MGFGRICAGDFQNESLCSAGAAFPTSVLPACSCSLDLNRVHQGFSAFSGLILFLTCIERHSLLRLSDSEPGDEDHVYSRSDTEYLLPAHLSTLCSASAFLSGVTSTEIPVILSFPILGIESKGQGCVIFFLTRDRFSPKGVTK